MIVHEPEVSDEQIEEWDIVEAVLASTLISDQL